MAQMSVEGLELKKEHPMERQKAHRWASTWELQ
jgi:hypothetical protein